MSEYEFHIHGAEGTGKTIVLSALLHFSNQSSDANSGHERIMERVEPSSSISTQLELLLNSTFTGKTPFTVNGGAVPTEAEKKGEYISFYHRTGQGKDTSKTLIYCHPGEIATSRGADQLSASQILNTIQDQPNKFLILAINPYLFDKQIAFEAFVRLTHALQQRDASLSFVDAAQISASILWGDTNADITTQPLIADCLVLLKNITGLRLLKDSVQDCFYFGGEMSGEAADKLYRHVFENIGQSRVIEGAFSKYNCELETDDERKSGERNVNAKKAVFDLMARMVRGVVDRHRSRVYNNLSELVRQLDDVIIVFTHLDLRTFVSVPNQDQLNTILLKDLFFQKVLFQEQIVATSAIQVLFRPLKSALPANSKEKSLVLFPSDINEGAGAALLRAMRFAIIRRSARRDSEHAAMQLTTENKRKLEEAKQAHETRLARMTDDLNKETHSLRTDVATLKDELNKRSHILRFGLSSLTAFSLICLFFALFSTLRSINPFGEKSPEKAIETSIANGLQTANAAYSQSRIDVLQSRLNRLAAALADFNKQPSWEQQSSINQIALEFTSDGDSPKALLGTSPNDLPVLLANVIDLRSQMLEAKKKATQLTEDLAKALPKSKIGENTNLTKAMSEPHSVGVADSIAALIKDIKGITIPEKESTATRDLTAEQFQKYHDTLQAFLTSVEKLNRHCAAISYLKLDKGEKLEAERKTDKSK